LCVTLVVYQESLHDARSAKYIKKTQLFFACGGLVFRICYIVLSIVFLIVPYSKNLAYGQCPIYCTKVALVWIFLENRWGRSKIVSWCGSCVYHKWQEVKEYIARRKLSWNWGFCRKNSRKYLAYLAVTAWILLESTCTATSPLKLRTLKKIVDQTR
jgi:ribosomal protein L44E